MQLNNMRYSGSTQDLLVIFHGVSGSTMSDPCFSLWRVASCCHNGPGIHPVSDQQMEGFCPSWKQARPDSIRTMCFCTRLEGPFANLWTPLPSFVWNKTWQLISIDFHGQLQLPFGMRLRGSLCFGLECWTISLYRYCRYYMQVI